MVIFVITKLVKSPLKYFNKFKRFDKVTELRLQNSFIIAFGMALFVPVLISLKGVYLAAWIISMFAIVQTLAVKQIIGWSKTSRFARCLELEFISTFHLF